MNESGNREGFWSRNDSMLGQITSSAFGPAANDTQIESMTEITAI